MKARITEEQARVFREIVKFTLDAHEWCERPSYFDRRCGTWHSEHCDEIPPDAKLNPWVRVPCDGCVMQQKAEGAFRRKRSTTQHQGGVEESP